MEDAEDQPLFETVFSLTRIKRKIKTKIQSYFLLGKFSKVKEDENNSGKRILHQWKCNLTIIQQALSTALKKHS